jgi:thiamine pyrophosphate-dependent acetolactate synthase large subunit-like protein
MGHDVSRVRFPEADLAAIGRAAGAKAASIRTVDDLAVVDEWLANAGGPLVLDAKVNPTIAAEWLAEAFRGG